VPGLRFGWATLGDLKPETAAKKASLRMGLEVALASSSAVKSLAHSDTERKGTINGEKGYQSKKKRHCLKGGRK